MEASLKSIRPVCDYINIVYSEESWSGEKSPVEIKPILDDLVARGLADEVLEYKIDSKSKKAREQKRKRNIGMKAALRAGCDYLMSMDSDEFYIADELEKLKSYILERKITHSYCKLMLYENPNKMYIPSKGAYNYYVQTFCKINRFSRFGGNIRVARCDPTRRIHTWLRIPKYFVFEGWYMHHYPFYRKDLCTKYENLSRRKNKRSVEEVVAWREGMKSLPVVECGNIFDMPIF
ncbi:MAG: hypothetical protein FWE64_01315 [Alphaproteobacteria bacterium]|nr:hypothetical protein [Alphaproteobacteria bacterium]